MSVLSRWPIIEPEMVAVSQWTAPFWEAAARHRLVTMRCTGCGVRRMPPTAFCPYCQSQNVDWPEIAGPGTIYSYTIISRGVTPRQAEQVPYAPALIEFEDAPGVRIVSNIVDAPLERIRIGAAVELVWQDGDNDVTMPRFRLIDDRGGSVSHQAGSNTFNEDAAKSNFRLR